MLTTTIGKPCSPHNNPANYRLERHGNTIKVYCTKCGCWIGNRPATERTATK